MVRLTRFAAAAISSLTALTMSAVAAAAPASASAGATPAPVLEPVFTATVLLGESLGVGDTPRGGRSLVRITGGHFEGPAVRGSVLPGGWDWQLRAAGDCTMLHADYMLRTDDGAVVNVVNDARLCPDASGKPGPIYSTPVFEAPLGRNAWLNGGAYVARIDVSPDKAKPAVVIAVYRAR